MIKNVLIIEDETAAAVNLKAMLRTIAPDYNVLATLESVEESVEYLSAEQNRHPELIFMDIHLADGESFRIFDKVEVTAPIIFTTAYDEYALRAFKVNSIDYLLKPIKAEDLQRALDKFSRLTQHESHDYNERINTMLSEKRVENKQEKAQAFLVHYKDKIIPLGINDIAYFYTSNEKVTATTHTGERYAIDRTLEQLQATLPEEMFFRANRQFIVSRQAVKDIAIWFGSRLSLNLKLETPEKIIISKARVPEFKQWLMTVHP
ncbi:MAG: response regulator transcription factor [Alistipes sp.]|nr:response regulator transcription factor [Alistipes sp.]